MPRLTVRALDAAKARDKEYKLTVDRDLYLRVSPSGVKTWLVRYVVHGKQRQTRLPRPYGNGNGFMSLTEACAENARIQSLAKEGVDVQEHTQQLLDEQMVQKAKKETEFLPVEVLFETWLSDGVARQDGNAELRRSFAKDVLPFIGDKPVKEITEQDLRDLLRQMISRGVKRMTVCAYHDLVQLFSWAEERQPWRSLLAHGNPAKLVDIRQIVGPDYDLNGERDRILSPAEVHELAEIFDRTTEEYENAPAGQKYQFDRPLKKENQLALWLCLSTLCRIGELLMAKWEHVDFNKAEWFIPKSNIKGRLAKKQDHFLFLSDFALQQFKALHALTGHTPWCFPSAKGDNHMDVKSVSKQVGDRQVRFKDRKVLACRRNDNTLVLAGGKNGEWTPHDLRRTGATYMQALKIPLDIIDRCQNHVLGGSRVRRHYLHYDYADEKREAWEKLGRRLEEILAK